MTDTRHNQESIISRQKRSTNSSDMPINIPDANDRQDRLIREIPVIGWFIKAVLWAFFEFKQCFRTYVNLFPGNTGAIIRRVYYRPRFKHCGKNLLIDRGFRLTEPEKISIGDNFHANSGLYITSGGGVEIGDYVLIGPDVKIWSVNHNFEDPDEMILNQGWNYSKVVIEDDVFIGAGSIILPGSEIGRGSVVSAGTVLSKKVPPFSIVAGNPGRIIGYRKREEK
ncbi:MAG: acyltransferase [candidate division Zixibacteria bacterium]|nr:acyltransferase [candidate division Zixibacteria bacterium]